MFAQGLNQAIVKGVSQLAKEQNVPINLWSERSWTLWPKVKSSGDYCAHRGKSMEWEELVNC